MYFYSRGLVNLNFILISGLHLQTIVGKFAFLNYKEKVVENKTKTQFELRMLSCWIWHAVYLPGL